MILFLVREKVVDQLVNVKPTQQGGNDRNRKIDENDAEHAAVIFFGKTGFCAQEPGRQKKQGHADVRKPSEKRLKIEVPAEYFNVVVAGTIKKVKIKDKNNGGRFHDVYPEELPLLHGISPSVFPYFSIFFGYCQILMPIPFPLAKTTR